MWMRRHVLLAFQRFVCVFHQLTDTCSSVGVTNVSILLFRCLSMRRVDLCLRVLQSLHPWIYIRATSGRISHQA